jgi:hypothetical protein
VEVKESQGDLAGKPAETESMEDPVVNWRIILKHERKAPWS